MAEVTVAVPVHNPKPRAILREGLRPFNPATSAVFKPQHHLSFSEYPQTKSLKDVGYPEDAGISPIAVSDPFPLFSEEAIRIMRSEILTNDVWENCMYSTEFAGCQLRGYSPKYAPFMYDAWNNPQTLAIISKIAGVDLIPVIDIEIGNINVSVQDSDNPVKVADTNEELPVTKWHHDSYPFVCVVMMSDASNMVGGETAIKTGTGDIIKVRGPQMGCGVVLQGRILNHQALAAVGGTERITMVTAFRPQDPFVPDDSVLTTIRPITEHSELYFQWTQYRIQVLQERLKGMLGLLEEQHAEGKPTDAAKIKEFLQLQEDWLQRTNREIIVEEVH